MSSITPNTGIKPDAGTTPSDQIVSLPTSKDLLAERGGCYSQSAPLDVYVKHPGKSGTVRPRVTACMDNATRKITSIAIDLSHVWIIDSRDVRLNNGNKCLVFAVMNEQTENFALAILENRKIPMRLVQELERIAKLEDYPSMIIGDHSPVFYSHDLTIWCRQHQVTIRLPHPHKPSPLNKLECLFYKLYWECLKKHDFESLHHLKTVLDDWSAAQ